MPTTRDVTVSKADLRQRCRTAVLDALEQMGGEGSRQEILARAERLAGFSVAELALLPPERARHTYRRLVDHQLSWALTNLKRDGLLDNPRWSHWQLKRPGTAAASPERLAAPTTATRLTELKTMPYAEYLKTLEWHRTRLAALERAEHRCQLDARHAARRLDVHHSDYARRGEERVADLVVLCAECHARYHDAGPEDVDAGADPREPKPSLLRRTLQRLR